MANITLIHSDINPRLAKLCQGAPEEQLYLFYAARRHWLEIIPEMLAALVFAIPCIYGLALMWPDQFWVLLFGLGLIFFIGLFLIEVWRWSGDIIFVSQYGLARRRFSFASWAWRVHDQSFVPNIDVIKPIRYTAAGLNIGSLAAPPLALSDKQLEKTVFTPLIPKPDTLRARINQSKAWKPGGEPGQLWREDATQVESPERSEA